MTTLRRISGILAALLVLASILACGAVGKVRESAARAKTTNDLKQLGLLYHNFNDDKKKGPASMAELDTFAKDPQTKSLVALTGSGGQYVLIWNIKVSDLAKTPAGISGTVLGYESKVPSEGGPVLFADASVRMMTADQFKKTPKAEPAAKK